MGSWKKPYFLWFYTGSPKKPYFLWFYMGSQNKPYSFWFFMRSPKKPYSLWFFTGSPKKPNLVFNWITKNLQMIFQPGSPITQKLTSECEKENKQQIDKPVLLNGCRCSSIKAFLNTLECSWRASSIFSKDASSIGFLLVQTWRLTLVFFNALFAF